jgi:hypothetical protein
VFCAHRMRNTVQAARSMRMREEAFCEISGLAYARFGRVNRGCDMTSLAKMYAVLGNGRLASEAGSAVSAGLSVTSSSSLSST